MTEEKKCPFCAETIKSEAKFCRFCNRALNAQASPITDKPVRAKSGVWDGVKIGCGMFIVLPILLIVGGITFLLWIGSCSAVIHKTAEKIKLEQQNVPKH
jgi:hypothetical protein